MKPRPIDEFFTRTDARRAASSPIGREFFSLPQPRAMTEAEYRRIRCEWKDYDRLLEGRVADCEAMEALERKRFLLLDWLSQGHTVAVAAERSGWDAREVAAERAADPDFDREVRVEMAEGAKLRRLVAEAEGEP